MPRKSGATQARRGIGEKSDPSDPDSNGSRRKPDRHSHDRTQMLIRISNELKFWVTVMAAQDGISSTDFIEKATAREVQRRFGDDWQSLRARAEAIQPVLAEITANDDEEKSEQGGDVQMRCP